MTNITLAGWQLCAPGVKTRAGHICGQPLHASLADGHINCHPSLHGNDRYSLFLCSFLVSRRVAFSLGWTWGWWASTRQSWRLCRTLGQTGRKAMPRWDLSPVPANHFSHLAGNHFSLAGNHAHSCHGQLPSLLHSTWQRPCKHSRRKFHLDICFLYLFV